MHTQRGIDKEKTSFLARYQEKMSEKLKGREELKNLKLIHSNSL